MQGHTRLVSGYVLEIIILLSIFSRFAICGDDWEENLGVDMCPEKAFVPGSVERDLKPRLGIDEHVENVESTLMQMLQKQQRQLDQMNGIVEVINQKVSELHDVVLDQDGKPQLKVTKDEVDFSLEKGVLQPDLEKKRQRLEKDQPKVGTRSREKGGMRIARYRPAWSEHFQFLSAVKVDGHLSCLHVLPHEDEHGLGKYVAVSDISGRLYIFSSDGDVLLDYSTNCPAPITVMLSVIINKNETLLVTGHSNGAVLAHRIWETTHSGAANGDEWQSLVIEYSHSFLPEPSNVLSKQAKSSEILPPKSMIDSNTHVANEIQHEVDAERSITNLEAYRVGRMRYILVTDTTGKIQVFRDNGTVYGIAQSPSRPRAFMRTTNTQRLLFLTDSGAASLDLRTMTVRNNRCEGMNSTFVACTFDAAGRSKAYGVTEDGHLVHVALSGDTMNFDCHARTKRKLEVRGSVKLLGLKGYLVVASGQQLLVYNTTLPSGFAYANIRVGDPRPLFTASLDTVVAAFLNTPVDISGDTVIASDRNKLVVLGFGDGYVGIFKSNLPVYKPIDFNAKLWSSPVVISVVLLIGGWLFFGKSKDTPVAGSQPDGVFGSGPGSPSFRKYETVRSGLGEARDTFDETRAFNTSSRRFGNTSNTYSLSALGLRTSTMETNSFSTRREPLFSTSQAVTEPLQ